MKQDNKNIEKILNSIDGINRVDAPDFFYTRLRARMETELLKEKEQPFILKPLFLTTCLVFILTINIFTLQQMNSSNIFKKQSPASIETFSKEYNIDNSQLY